MRQGRTLNDEEMGTFVLAVEDQARLDDAVRRHHAEGADPPLGRADGTRTEDERVLLRVIRRSGLELLHVRTVGQLGLEVAAEDLVAEALGKPLALLLVRPLGLDDGGERDLVQVESERLVDERKRRVVLFRSPVLLVDKGKEVAGQAEPAFELLRPG